MQVSRIGILMLATYRNINTLSHNDFYLFPFSLLGGYCRLCIIYVVTIVFPLAGADLETLPSVRKSSY